MKFLYIIVLVFDLGLSVLNHTVNPLWRIAPNLLQFRFNSNLN